MAEPTMEEKFRHNAELTIQTIRDQCAVELAYDEASVVWLDGYIERLRDGIDPKFKDSLVGIFGSYLGESIRRRFGGRWHEQDGRWAIRFDEQNAAFPFAKVFKQFEHGAQDSIAAFYRAIPALFKLS